jgi:glycosyltransferase involved in cell wall biosynthesis
MHFDCSTEERYALICGENWNVLSEHSIHQNNAVWLLIVWKDTIVHKLGVLMSIYHSDSPGLLERALQSILSQKFSSTVEIRIYLGVDGLVPNSLQAVIEQYKPYIHKSLFFENNRGLAHVLNDLIRAREDEEFFFRMDADDISEPHRLERQLAYMRAHPETDILGTDMLEVDLVSGSKRIVRFAANPEEARQNIARRVPVAHPTVCFRARVFDRIPQYPEIRLNEDIAMWFSCIKAGLVFDNLHEALYQFSIGPDFWKRRSASKAWAEFLIYIRGIWELEGLTWKYVFPFLRLLIRLAPMSLQRVAYTSSLRPNTSST